MGIFYSDNGGDSSGFPVDYYKMNATKHFLTHYANMLTLDFIAKTTKDMYEKAQATKEKDIADRKMNYWKRHPNYDQEKALREVQKLKEQWR
jgi:hypothetical protein